MAQLGFESIWNSSEIIGVSEDEKIVQIKAKNGEYGSYYKNENGEEFHNTLHHSGKISHLDHEKDYYYKSEHDYINGNPREDTYNEPKEDYWY